MQENYGDAIVLVLPIDKMFVAKGMLTFDFYKAG